MQRAAGVETLSETGAASFRYDPPPQICPQRLSMNHDRWRMSSEYSGSAASSDFTRLYYEKRSRLFAARSMPKTALRPSCVIFSANQPLPCAAPKRINRLMASAKAAPGQRIEKCDAPGQDGSCLPLAMLYLHGNRFYPAQRTTGEAFMHWSHVASVPGVAALSATVEFDRQSCKQFRIHDDAIEPVNAGLSKSKICCLLIN